MYMLSLTVCRDLRFVMLETFFIYVNTTRITTDLYAMNPKVHIGSMLNYKNQRTTWMHLLLLFDMYIYHYIKEKMYVTIMYLHSLSLHIYIDRMSYVINAIKWIYKYGHYHYMIIQFIRLDNIAFKSASIKAYSYWRHNIDKSIVW